MRILLAPMEGVVDHTMRDMLTTVGGIDRCVTEFVRVTHTVLPARVFYRYCPELRTAGKTASGVPVYVQLLGGNAELMAQNAAKVAKLGAPGIDLNFGCPAKLVNRHDGGSVLLQEPGRVHRIIRAVRDAVPADTPVTAKIRLGFNDSHFLQDICQGVFAANASELTIHARTRADGYKPPARWSAIAPVAANSPIPIIANGEIWTPGDAENCRRDSGCRDIMLGRGVLSCPDLARQIQSAGGAPVLRWLDIIELLLQFCQVTELAYEAKYVGSRVKQWLGYLRRQYREATVLFEAVKRLQQPEDIAGQIRTHRDKLRVKDAA